MLVEFDFKNTPGNVTVLPNGYGTGFQYWDKKGIKEEIRKLIQQVFILQKESSTRLTINDNFSIKLNKSKLVICTKYGSFYHHLYIDHFQIDSNACLIIVNKFIAIKYA